MPRGLICASSNQYVQSMDLSRRKLISLSAVGASAATGLVIAGAPAHADSEVPGEAKTARLTDADQTAYDRSGRRDNPQNPLGCPLGKGE